MSYINKSEDKILEFTLVRDIAPWECCREYIKGDWACYNKVYYSAKTKIGADSGTPDINADWEDEGDCPPKIDIDSQVKGMIVALYQNPLIIIEQYSLVDNPNFQKIFPDGSRTGVFYVELISEKTLKAINEQKCKAEIKVLLIESAFTSGKMITIVSDIEIDPVKDCVTKNLTIPE